MKRGRSDSGEDQDNKEITSGESKKVTRSPNYNRREEEKEMEEFRQMQAELLAAVKNISEKLQENTEKLQANTEEIKKLKAETKKKEEEWNKEKRDLYKRIEIMEEKLEKQEKLKRRNNTVITGIKLRTENMENEIEQFVKNELDITAKAITVYETKSTKTNKYIVEWSSWQEKKAIMENKSKLKETNKRIYIENHLTKEEDSIQYELRNIARDQKKRNNDTRIKIGYQKITIGNEEYRWDKEEANIKLIETKSKNSASRNNKP